MKRPTKKNISILRGIIIPVGWNDKGGITSIALSTYNEEEYIIRNDEKFQGLVNILRQEVELTGDITTDHNKKSISVHSFILKSSYAKDA